MNRRSTDEVLEEALSHLQLAVEYATRDLDQQMVLDAASMRLAAGIDALFRLESHTRNDLFGQEWKAMWGMRNRIAHGYLLVDSSIVRQTLVVELPDLVERISQARRDIADLG